MPLSHFERLQAMGTDDDFAESRMETDCMVTSDKTKTKFQTQVRRIMQECVKAWELKIPKPVFVAQVKKIVSEIDGNKQ